MKRTLLATFAVTAFFTPTLTRAADFEPQDHEGRGRDTDQGQRQDRSEGRDENRQRVNQSYPQVKNEQPRTERGGSRLEGRYIPADARQDGRDYDHNRDGNRDNNHDRNWDRNRDEQVDRRYDRNNNERIDRRYDQSRDGNLDRHYDRNNGHDGRWSNSGREDRWNTGWRNDRRYDWRQHRNNYRDFYRPGRYYSPYRDHSYSRISIGSTIGSPYYGSRYWINDPEYYRLPPAYGPYRWVRYYDDVLLIDIRSGYVVDKIDNFFW
jgi:Ni/Co efflux regulator RcnB